MCTQHPAWIGDVVGRASLHPDTYFTTTTPAALPVLTFHAWTGLTFSSSDRTEGQNTEHVCASEFLQCILKAVDISLSCFYLPFLATVGLKAGAFYISFWCFIIYTVLINFSMLLCQSFWAQKLHKYVGSNSWTSSTLGLPDTSVILMLFTFPKLLLNCFSEHNSFFTLIVLSLTCLHYYLIQCYWCYQT